MSTKITKELIRQCQGNVYYGNTTCRECACTEIECLECLLEQIELLKEDG